jgi:hypothetical protein
VLNKVLSPLKNYICPHQSIEQNTLLFYNFSSMKKSYLNLSFNNTEFHSISLKFRNLSNKIDSLLSTGKFWAFSKSQQQKLLTKLRSLYEKLSGFNPKYALKVAGAAMCFTLIAGAANATVPTFQKWSLDKLPFSFNSVRISSSYNATSYQILDGVFADIDKDNDLDALLLTDCGPVYFENIGGVYTENLAKNPFSRSCGASNNLNIIGYGTGIDVADFDGDGDLDAIIINGNNSGNITHFEMNSGKFNYVSGGVINTGNSGSPLYFDNGYQAKFADVDGDNDLDIVGTWNCGIATYIQQPNHTFIYSNCMPLDQYTGMPTSPENATINLADMDGDGDADLFIFQHESMSPPPLANATGNMSYYENTSGNGIFSPNSNIPLPIADMSDVFIPILADLDGDGDLDVFVPGSSGMGQTAFQNLGGNAVPIPPLVALLAFAATGFGIFRRNRKKKVE